MGQSIPDRPFTDHDRKLFQQRLHDSLSTLREVLREPGFGAGPQSLGAELEYYLVNGEQTVHPCNQEILAAVNDPQLTLELNRFNLEYNLNPQNFSGSPLLSFEEELQDAQQRINRAADPLGADLVSIGILPTLSPGDIDSGMMTDVPRYHCLSDALKSLRKEPFRIHIDGTDSLRYTCPEVTLEGANTSFQLHWRVPAAEFVDYYNAIQLSTPLVLALSGNSPGIFGKRLWEETRIALFKQSIDSRGSDVDRRRRLARVDFGHGWLTDAWNLFASAVAIYPPLLPIHTEQDPVKVWRSGRLPDFSELRLHMGSTWPWNRAILDPQNNGHLRIEIRYLPSPPSLTDMSANALLAIGLARYLLPHMATLTALLPFEYAEYNFYQAARYGLKARLVWPCLQTLSLLELTPGEVLTGCLDGVELALRDSELNATEIDRLLPVIRNRLQNGQTGSVWQRTQTALYCKDWSDASSVAEAHTRMLTHYRNHQKTGQPVGDWSLEP